MPWDQNRPGVRRMIELRQQLASGRYVVLAPDSYRIDYAVAKDATLLTRVGCPGDTVRLPATDARRMHARPPAAM